MKKSIIQLSVIVFCTFILFGCSKESNSGTNPGNSREVKYEIIGNFPEKIIVAYQGTQGIGSTETEEILAPWSKTIVYPSSIMAAGIARGATIASSDAMIGKEITLNLYSAGKLVKTSSGKVNASKVINIPSLLITF